MTNSSLLSIGQLCDHECVAVFTKHAMHLYHNAKVILRGVRNTSDGLWDVNLPSNPSQSTSPQPTLQMNAIVQKNMPKSQLADYLHACAFSPALPTFKKAIANGQFITWPSIDKINFPKFITDQTATHMGHLDQERTNLQSTKLDRHIKNDFSLVQTYLKSNSIQSAPRSSLSHQRNYILWRSNWGIPLYLLQRK